MIAGASARSVVASSKRTSARSTPGGTSGRRLSEHRDRQLHVPCEAVEGRRLQAPPPGQTGIGRRQIGGELGELGRGCGRSAGGRLLGGGVQLGRNCCVGAFGGEGEMARPLLDVR